MKNFNQNLIGLNKKNYLKTTYRNIYRILKNGFIPLDCNLKQGIIEETKIQLS